MAALDADPDPGDRERREHSSCMQFAVRNEHDGQWSEVSRIFRTFAQATAAPGWLTWL
jgi:hypothetical protein